MALEVESEGKLEAAGIPVLYTGIGKVNAALTLMRALTEAKVKGTPITRVVNFGTCGSFTFNRHTLVAADRFVQHDMDVTGLGFKPGETPFENDPFTLSFEPFFNELPHGICGSGDRFVQTPPQAQCDVVDMEAYALAKVCAREGVHFVSAKYVTDGADGAAHEDWQTNTKHAAEKFIALYGKHFK